jgi:hypothetical protein
VAFSAVLSASFAVASTRQCLREIADRSRVPAVAGKAHGTVFHVP